MNATSPTDPGFYAGHHSPTLERIVADKTAAGMHIALTHGATHPLAVENLAIANAAWAELTRRQLGI